MADASTFRDSTQIVLPRPELEGLCEELDQQFTVTLFEEDGYVRIIGSPVVIKDVGNFLARQGVSLP
ncbi:hypothetical protein [Halospeciosus flavus]|uniref:Uncharacterized protein n=1 Tax=Halospeciosus flavus TaxID=3032283 RepID=A0ABD5Z2I9_9EURY|nr:hypothetical protein [Halospeciosus flavus]